MCVIAPQTRLFPPHVVATNGVQNHLPLDVGGLFDDDKKMKETKTSNPTSSNMDSGRATEHEDAAVFAVRREGVDVPLALVNASECHSVLLMYCAHVCMIAISIYLCACTHVRIYVCPISTWTLTRTIVPQDHLPKMCLLSRRVPPHL